MSEQKSVCGRRAGRMMKRIKDAVRNGITLILGPLFTLFAAPVIYLSGLDNVDGGPTKEDIEKSRRFAESLKGGSK